SSTPFCGSRSSSETQVPSAGSALQEVAPPPHGALFEPTQITLASLLQRPQAAFGNTPGQTVAGLDAQYQSSTPLKFLSSPQFATVFGSERLEVEFSPTVKPWRPVSKSQGTIVRFLPVAFIEDHCTVSKR